MAETELYSCSSSCASTSPWSAGLPITSETSNCGSDMFCCLKTKDAGRSKPGIIALYGEDSRFGIDEGFLSIKISSLISSAAPSLTESATIFYLRDLFTILLTRSIWL